MFPSMMKFCAPATAGPWTIMQYQEGISLRSFKKNPNTKVHKNVGRFVDAILIDLIPSPRLLSL